MTNKRTIGFWVLVAFGIFFFVMLLVGQTMSFIDYDFTVSIGLQESKDMVGEMGVAINKGFGVGDTIIYLPLLVIGVVGLWFRKMWGLFAMAGALGVSAYWPMVVIFFLAFAKGSTGFDFTNFTSYTILLTPVTLYGLWGLWYLYTNRRILAEE
jgi:hypothetical protein